MKRQEKNPRPKKIVGFQDLEAWREAHHLVIQVYRVAEDFPKNEEFGLTSQLKRALISVTSNIAEGFSRYSYSERNHYYLVARGSLSEVESLLLTARDLGFVKKPEFEKLFQQAEKVSAILNGLIRATRARISSPRISSSRWRK